MKCELVKKDDYQAINGWYGARKIQQVPDNYFPSVGFIVKGVCAGFLYQTDSSLAFIDGYISNPVADKELVDLGLDMVTANIVLAAKEHGFTNLLAYTGNKSIRKRCEKLNFEHKGTADLFVKGL